MLLKKISRVLVVSIISLSLMFGQGVVLAVDQDVQNSTSKRIAFSSTSVSAGMGTYSITGNGVYVRAEPNTSSTRLGKLYKDNGDYITVYAEDSTLGWVYGYTSTGIWGWVASQYTTMY